MCSCPDTPVHWSRFKKHPTRPTPSPDRLHPVSICFDLQASIYIDQLSIRVNGNGIEQSISTHTTHRDSFEISFEISIQCDLHSPRCSSAWCFEGFEQWKNVEGWSGSQRIPGATSTPEERIWSPNSTWSEIKNHFSRLPTSVTASQLGHSTQTTASHCPP